MKIAKLENSTKLLFWCPGCRCLHWFQEEAEGEDKSTWKWNGDFANPTVESSISTFLDKEQTKKCHSYIREGKIKFLEDSWHDLKGKTTILPEIYEEKEEQAPSV
jgi:hypothetical protein